MTNSRFSSQGGISLNSLLPGPRDQLSSMTRGYNMAFLSDITKASYQMVTGELEFHVCRVLWRDSREGPWEIFGFRTASMVDRPAAYLLEIVAKLATELFSRIDLVAASRILRDRYVDDITSGGSRIKVKRFIGIEPENLKCTGTVPFILKEAGLVLKEISVSGEPDGNKLAKLGGAALGLSWSSEADLISIKF